MTLNQFAQWIGLTLMAVGAVSIAALGVAFALDYVWTVTKRVHDMSEIQRAMRLWKSMKRNGRLSASDSDVKSTDRMNKDVPFMF